MSISAPLHRPSKLLTELIDTRSAREAVWLWLYLEEQEEQPDGDRTNFPPESCNGETILAVLDAGLKRMHEWRLSKIKAAKDDALLADQHLDWITGSVRQTTYLEMQISRELPRLRYPNLYGRTLLIAKLDSWHASVEEKADYIAQIKRQWERQKESSEKHCGWLKAGKDTPERVKHAIAWLDENHLKTGIRRPMPRDSSAFEDILTYFDSAELRLLEVKEIINSIRASWNKKKYRERNTEKRQLNVTIPNAAIEALDLLTKKTGRTRAEVIERLIAEEEENEMYLE